MVDQACICSIMSEIKAHMAYGALQCAHRKSRQIMRRCNKEEKHPSIVYRHHIMAVVIASWNSFVCVAWSAPTNESTLIHARNFSAKISARVSAKASVSIFAKRARLLYLMLVWNVRRAWWALLFSTTEPTHTKEDTRQGSLPETVGAVRQHARTN